MKQLKSLTLVVVAVIALITSCNDQVKPQMSSNAKLATLMIGSDNFKNLNISTDSLDIEKSYYTDTSKLFFAIPYHNTDKEVLMFSLDKSGKILTAMNLRITTNIPSGEIADQLQAKTFIGVFQFAFEEGSFEINVQKSVLSYQNIRLSTARTLKCAYWATDGGNTAFSCAGRRLVAMNWFDSAICYATFGACIAQNVISCAIDGCPR